MVEIPLLRPEVAADAGRALSYAVASVEMSQVLDVRRRQGEIEELQKRYREIAEEIKEMERAYPSEGPTRPN